MRLAPAAVAAYAGLAAAHGNGLPNIIGGGDVLSELRERAFREFAQEPRMAARADHARRDAVLARKISDGRCGPGIGSCAAGSCCSLYGWCGVGPGYCNAPDCLLSYGPACDGNTKPSGLDTSTIARPKIGKVLYGGLGIYSCVTKGDIAITYDDGPFTYTNDLLDKFKAQGNVATFFVTGVNQGKGAIDDPSKPWPAILKRMAAEGHQIASHSWSHQNASQLTLAQQRAQIINLEMAINNVLGYFPTYMRPPFSICPQQCQDVLADLGYHIIYFNLDTQGYLRDSASLIQTSKDTWDQAVERASPATTSFLHIEHELQYQVVYNLTDYMLTSLNRKGFRSVTVGQCLGDAPANWYRAGGGVVPSYPPPNVNVRGNSTIQQTAMDTAPSSRTSSTAPASTLLVSTEANCGNGITCQGSLFGNCCSQYGWCGTTEGHCGTGCQAEFGTCAGAQKLSGTASAADAGSTSTLVVSTGAECGNGVTCQGSPFGNCCSQYGWCGSSDGHCGTGCQPQFGTCSGSSSSSKASSSPSNPQMSASPTS